MTTLGWLAIAGALASIIGLLRALTTLNALFPLDPEIRSTGRPADEPIEMQWPRQAHLTDLIGRARRSRRVWGAFGPSMLRPLATRHNGTEFGSAWIDLHPPRRYSHTWMDGALRTTEAELGIGPGAEVAHRSEPHRSEPHRSEAW